MSDNTLLQLKSVSISIGSKRLFEPLSVNVKGGGVTTLMGPSGCGKSTLLAFICGTIDRAFETTGEVNLDGIDVTGLPPEERGIGILFQDDLLFPHLSVAENLGFGMSKSLSRSERERRLQSALLDADLEGFGDRDPGTLSGGQRARIAVMRTLLAQPRALLLDEPFAKLDMELRDRFRDFVFDHARKAAIPTLMVTHDEADATAAGGPILEMA